MAFQSDNRNPEGEAVVGLNGVDARTGRYLLEPLSAQAIAAIARGEALGDEADLAHLAELKFRNTQKGKAHYGVKDGVDPTRLDQAGWGVIFPAVAKNGPDEREQAAIREALLPLLSLRRAQATKYNANYYKEFCGADGYRPGESKQRFLARLGAAPGPADPEVVPYYLLLVASPQAIPYHVQYQIDVQYAVGRIHFDTVEEYANYARSVVAAETSGLAVPREVAFVGVSNQDDPATQMSREDLVERLATMAEGWKDVPPRRVARYYDDGARKSSVSRLFGGDRTPALLFTASHGIGFPKGDPLQLRHQGALLLQDWQGPGSGPVGESLYFSGDDVTADANLSGLIAFHFACYGAGTPELDEFAKQAFKRREAIADRAFVAGLPRRLLGHPKGGALAVVGHVERAWGCSFMWATGKRRTQTVHLAVFESALKSLLRGAPVGLALERFNERYAELASDLAQQLEELDFDPGATDDYTLAEMWTSSNDARGYAIVGDPAVRLPFAPPEGAPAPTVQRAAS